MSDHGDVLRSLAERTDWAGDDGARQTCLDAIDRIDPPADEAAEAPKQAGGRR